MDDGIRRESDHLFGMGNSGAGPRWLAEVTKAPFDTGIPQLQPPRCDTRVTPEEREFLAWRAQETKQRRALFNAETEAEMA